MANVALAINPSISYSVFKVDNDYIICHLDLTKVDFLKDKVVEKISEIEPGKLIGLKYVPLYEDIEVYTQNKKVYEIVEASFVSSTDGTGVVHIAPAFGIDDMELGTQKDLAVILNVDDAGKMMTKENILEAARGVFFKTADPIIFEDLKTRNILLFGDLKGTEHEYPFC
jgi:isoleucyl-tRNA synthetase